MLHAAAHSATLHYLKTATRLGVAQAKADGRATVAAMKAMPTDDDCFGPGSIRVDGRKLHPAYLFEAKHPAESTGPWDLFRLVGTTRPTRPSGPSTKAAANWPNPEPTMTHSFDDRNITWRKFDFLGSAYFVYAANENEGVVDVLIRFPPHARGTLHQHTMDYITIVLQGELRFYRPDGTLKEVRPTGSYTRVAANGEPHREGAGEQEAIVLFSIRGGTGPMFTIWEDDGTERILGFADFKAALDAQIESGDYVKIRGWALLQTRGEARDAADYDAKALREAVERDRDILRDLAARMDEVTDDADPKLAAVVEELARIAAQAKSDSATDAEEQRNRKVLVFSYFADTVTWLRQALEARIATDKRLKGFHGRIVAVAGGGLESEEANRNQAVWGFAPESSDPPTGQEDLYDLLITTDVLAEGMNLQQCRHILNYDLPWNPMRLVQRHGRVDRIGSPHPRIFLRTVFPADRLDALLALEARILRKLTQAAKSIGVSTLPVDGGEAGEQVFAETRAEIEKLAAEDPTLFEQGGTAAAAQTGEEYRQRLRAALEGDRKAITELPGRTGSGMRKGAASGVLFCAEVELIEGRRTFLRFVPAEAGWQPANKPGGILRETGTCLRLIDCTEDTPRHMPSVLADRVFDFWELALTDILAEWDDLSDPANLQPPVRLLNRQVAAFLRAHPPHDADTDKFAKALDVLEAPWPRREESLLRQQFQDRTGPAIARSARLIDWILGTGLERFEPPPPLPPITPDDLRLVCWMAVDAEKADESQSRR